MKRFVQPTISCAWVLFVVLSACSGGAGGSGGPSEGSWLAERLFFRLEAGAVSDVRPLGVSCNGERDGLACSAQFAGLLDGALPVVDDAFAGTLAGAGGEIALEGRFTDATRAEGTLVYRAADGCCEATYLWTAEFRPPTYADASEYDAGGGADGGTGGADTGGGLDPSLSADQVAAIEITNGWRERLGLPAVRSTTAIHRAAQAHADYYVENCDRMRDDDVTAHEESPDHPGFTGASFFDRMIAQGWSGRGGWEVMSFGADPEAAIDSWLQTLYHRIPFVHPNAVEAGYGNARGGGAGCGGAAADVMDFGRGSAARNAPVRFPPDGYDLVPPRWDGRESPQPPLPAGESYPSGPVLTLTFPDGGALTVTAHRLAGPDDVDIPHVLRTPADDAFLSSTIALYAHDPLEPGTTYTVTIDGTRTGQAFSERWTFSTAR